MTDSEFEAVEQDHNVPAVGAAAGNCSSSSGDEGSLSTSSSSSGRGRQQQVEQQQRQQQQQQPLRLLEDTILKQAATNAQHSTAAATAAATTTTMKDQDVVISYNGSSQVPQEEMDSSMSHNNSSCASLPTVSTSSEPMSSITSMTAFGAGDNETEQLGRNLLRPVKETPCTSTDSAGTTRCKEDALDKGEQQEQQAKEDSASSSSSSSDKHEDLGVASIPSPPTTEKAGEFSRIGGQKDQDLPDKGHAESTKTLSKDDKYALLQQQQSLAQSSTGAVMLNPDQVRLNDTFVRQIQPIPSGPHQSSEPTEPGAHAIGGRPRFYGGAIALQQQQQQQQRMHSSNSRSPAVPTDEEEQQPTIHVQDEAFVVEEEPTTVSNDEETILTAETSTVCNSVPNNNCAVMTRGCSRDDETATGGISGSFSCCDNTHNNYHGQEDGPEIVEAKILEDDDDYDDDEEDAGRSKVYFILLLLTAVLAGLAIILCVVFLVPSSNPDLENASSSIGGTTNPSSTNDNVTLYPPFRDDLPKQTVKFIQDPQHSHYRANQWMLNDPNLHSYSKERQKQRFHMSSFYYTTLGDQWFQNDGWLSYENHECDWFQKGYQDEPICDDDGYILTVALPANNLQGYFYVVDSFIDTLQFYDVGYNNISGLAPASTSSSKLEVYIISNNNFQGQLITGGTFGAFDLRVVKLDGNKLLGDVSPMFQFLRKLEVVNITNNMFHGELADELKYCTSLTYLGIAWNQFEGTIPASWQALTNLQEIDMAGNIQVHGEIPTELGLLAINGSLTNLDISGTSIEGQLPESFCNRVEESIEILADCDTVKCCEGTR